MIPPPLSVARDFIARERECFIECNSILDANGLPDPGSLDDDARRMLAEDFDPALAAVDAAMQEQAWLTFGAACVPCRGCGCTDERACEGGCWWVEPDLCSTCARHFRRRGQLAALLTLLGVVTAALVLIGA